jgi:hypothetical protein
MGYQDKIKADLDKQIAQYSAKALATINAKLPPLNADGIRSVLPLNKIPAIPGVPSIPSIKVCLPDINALTAQIKHDIPPIPSISNVTKLLPTFKTPPLSSILSVPTKEDIWKMLPVDVRKNINLAQTDVETLKTHLVSSLPPIPPIPPMPALQSIVKTLCAPPPEAPEAKTLMPTVVKQAIAAIPATLKTAAVAAVAAVIKTPMDDQNINKKAQLAIIGEIERQRMVNEIIVKLTAIIPVCDDINAKMQDFSGKIYVMTDKANLGTDEATWKTTLDDLQTSVLAVYTASDPISDAVSGIYHDYCIDPNSVDSTVSLYNQKTSPLMNSVASITKKLGTFISSTNLEFYNNLCDSVIPNIQNSIEKFGYAQWKGYDTDLDWAVLAKKYWSVLQSNATFTDSITNESITDTYVNLYARKHHEVINITITRLQATLPDK